MSILARSFAASLAAASLALTAAAPASARPWPDLPVDVNDTLCTVGFTVFQLTHGPDDPPVAYDCVRVPFPLDP